MVSLQELNLMSCQRGYTCRTVGKFWNSEIVDTMSSERTLNHRDVIDRVSSCKGMMHYATRAIRSCLLWNVFTCGFKTRIFATNRMVERKYANYRMFSYFTIVQWVTAVRRFFVSKVNPFLCQKHAYWRPICMLLCVNVMPVGSQYAVSNAAMWRKQGFKQRPAAMKDSLVGVLRCLTTHLNSRSFSIL